MRTAEAGRAHVPVAPMNKADRCSLQSSMFMPVSDHGAPPARRALGEPAPDRCTASHLIRETVGVTASRAYFFHPRGRVRKRGLASRRFVVDPPRSANGLIARSSAGLLILLAVGTTRRPAADIVAFERQGDADVWVDVIRGCPRVDARAVHGEARRSAHETRRALDTVDCERARSAVAC